MTEALIVYRSASPIIRNDTAWENGGIFSAVGSFVEDDEKTIRLYYQVRFQKDPVRNILCVARSTDMETWQKPDFGDGTNIVMRSSGERLDYGTFLPCRILRERNTEGGVRSWTMLYWDKHKNAKEPGFYIATSSDGLSWYNQSILPKITNSNDAGSLINALPSDLTPIAPGSHYLYQQTWKHNTLLPTERDNLKGIHRRISIWSLSSLSGTWRGPITILEPDELDPFDMQHYWLSPFFTATGYGGFLHCHHTGNQTMDVQLVSSVDGWSWKRELNREAILPVGPKGAFDCGMVSIWGEPLVFNNRVFALYSGRPTVHDGKPRFADAPQPTDGIGLVEFSPEIFNL